jgi:phage terminase large subunit
MDLDLLWLTQDDPDLFNELFVNDGRSFWVRQRELCDAIVRYRTVACYSGNMVGKDFAIGRIIWWWLYTRPDSLVIVTGPSQTNLGSVTWKEVRRARPHLASARLSRGVKTSPQQVDCGGGWQALGFSTTSIERASGQHNDQLLVVVDEASGVEEEIWDAIESLGYERLVAIGNPIRAEGRFVDLIRQADKDAADGILPRLAVKAIQIPSTESPHAMLDKSPWGIADRTWLESCYRRYGHDSLWVRSHIRAEIPEVSSDVLIDPRWLDRAASVQRAAQPPNHPIHRSRRIAIDLGEGVGRDSTAILVRDANGILDLVAGSALSLADAAHEVSRLSRVWSVPADRVSYDKLGIGRDFRNHLVKHGLGDAIGYAGSGRPQDRKAFTNLRTEAAWKLRRRLNPEHHVDDRYPLSSRQPPFHIPPRAWWALLREDLEALTYDLVGNQTRLLKKEDWCDVLGRSPDRGDAFIQSFFQEPMR